MGLIKLKGVDGDTIVINSNDIVDIVEKNKRSRIECYRFDKVIYNVVETPSQIFDIIQNNHSEIAELKKTTIDYSFQCETAIKLIHELSIENELLKLKNQDLIKSNDENYQLIQDLEEEVKEFDNTPKSQYSIGLNEIISKRTRQLLVHNISIENDMQFNPDGQLQLAAAYLLTGCIEFYPKTWDRLLEDKFVKNTFRDNLILAGSFIAAELDRLHVQKT